MNIYSLLYLNFYLIIFTKPTTQALIVDYLGLKTGCYEDETKIDGPCERFNIVDDDGTKIGYVLTIEALLLTGSIIVFSHNL